MYKTDAGSDPYYFVSNFQFRKKLNSALKKLHKIDKDIIFLSVGMYSEEKNLIEITKYYNFAKRQRVIIFRNRGIKKLRELMQ